MEKFILLFRGGDTHVHNAKDSEEVKAYIQSWDIWMGGLAQKGILAGGDPLQTTGKVIIGKNKDVTNDLLMDGKEMIGGYLLVNANDLDEAVEIAKGCPIFEEDGKVEVRQIQKRN
jgi:hypothetical protein